MDKGQEAAFHWSVQVAGYQLVEMRKRRDLPDSAKPLLMLYAPVLLTVSQARGSVRPYLPRIEYPALFRTFADTPMTPEGVLQFANRFGMLGGKAGVQTDRLLPSLLEYEDESYEIAEPVVDWLNAILQMRKAVGLWDMLSSGDAAGIARLFVQGQDGLQFRPKPEWLLADWRASDSGELTADSGSFRGHRLKAAEPMVIYSNVGCRFERQRVDDLSYATGIIDWIVNDELDAKSELMTRNYGSDIRPNLSHLPQSLGGALWLQFAESICQGRRHRICKQCGEWFEIPLRGARISREYCSNGCRSKAYRNRQERARELASGGMAPREIAREFDTTVSVVRTWLKSGKGK